MSTTLYAGPPINDVEVRQYLRVGNPYLTTPRDIYAATFGAMVAAQVTDIRSMGLANPDEDDMARIAEEANAVAEMAVLAWMTLSTETQP